MKYTAMMNGAQVMIDTDAGTITGKTYEASKLIKSEFAGIRWDREHKAWTMEPAKMQKIVDDLKPYFTRVFKLAEIKEVSEEPAKAEAAEVKPAVKPMKLEIRVRKNVAILDTADGTISGDTYYIKDWLKKYFNMKWNAKDKVWMVDAAQAIEALKANRSEFAGYVTVIEDETEATGEQSEEAAPVEISKPYDADLPGRAADICEANFDAEAAKALAAQPDMKAAIEERATAIRSAVRDTIQPEFTATYADPAFHDRRAANSEAERRVTEALAMLSDRAARNLAGMVLQMYMKELAKLPDRG